MIEVLLFLHLIITVVNIDTNALYYRPTECSYGRTGFQKISSKILAKNPKYKILRKLFWWISSYSLQTDGQWMDMTRIVVAVCLEDAPEIKVFGHFNCDVVL